MGKFAELAYALKKGKDPGPDPKESSNALPPSEDNDESDVCTCPKCGFSGPEKEFEGPAEGEQGAPPPAKGTSPYGQQGESPKFTPVGGMWPGGRGFFAGGLKGVGG